MMTAVEGMHGGLSSLADTLQIDRIGPMHQVTRTLLPPALTYLPYTDRVLLFLLFYVCRLAVTAC